MVEWTYERLMNVMYGYKTQGSRSGELFESTANDSDGPHDRELVGCKMHESGLSNGSQGEKVAHRLRPRTEPDGEGLVEKR